MKTQCKLAAARKLLETKGTAHLCRTISGDEANRPVTVVEGKQSPHMVGKGPHAVSRTGIEASLAALKRFWGTYSYVPSTRRTAVGADWLLAKQNRPTYRTDDGVTMLVMPGRVVRVGNIRLIPGWIKGVKSAIAIKGKRTYHLDRSGVMLKDFRTRAPQLAEEAVNAWRAQDQHAKTEKLFLRDIGNTRVTLQDSRTAGNCVEGSLQFAERKLGIPRSEVLASGYLLGVSAARVLRHANGQTPQAKRACMAAWLRETQISI